jgi:hypothetical protein
MRYLIIAILLLASAGITKSQTVGPLVAEGGKGRARGEFTVTNNGVIPMITTVRVMQFKLTPEGKSIFLPLDNTISVKLGESSAKVGARQEHSFSYEILCLRTEPCLVAFLPRMVTSVHTTEGIQVGLIIPHSVYLCADQEKAKGCRARVRKAAGIPEGK